MIALFAFFGYYATQIYLEEDINKMLPSSKNPDGTTKLAFADLKIKDKTFLLFESKGADADSLIAVCDAFLETLNTRNAALDSADQLLDDVFATLPEDLMYDGIDYVMAHLPNFIDTAVYRGIDTLLNEEKMQAQMEANREAFSSPLGQMFPELIQMDPVGVRNVLMDQMKDVMGAGTSYTIYQNHFFTPDTTVCIVFITPHFSSTNTGQGALLFQIFNEEIENFGARAPNVKISYNGATAYGAYNSWQTKADLKNTVMGSMLVVLLVIFLCFRNWNTIPLLILPVVFGTCFGLAMMYFIRGQFSLLALGIGAIILGVALSYVLHVLTHYKYVSDPIQVLRDQVKPVLLGCITTIGSFLGLIFVNLDLLKDFGMFATFAIVGTTLFALAYLPQFFNPRKNKRNRRAFAIIDKINVYPFDKSKPLIIIIAVLALTCVGFWVFGFDKSYMDADMRNIGYFPDHIMYSEEVQRIKTQSGDKQQYFATSGETMEEAIGHFSEMAAKLDSLQQIGLVHGYTHTDELFVPLTVQQERIDAWQAYWNEDRLAQIRALINKTAPKAGLNPEAFETFFEKATSNEWEPDALYEANIIPFGFQSTLMEQSYGGGYLCFSSVMCERDSVRSNTTDYHRICDAIGNEPHMMVLDTYYYTSDALVQLNDDFNVLQWVSMIFVFIVLLLSFRSFKLSLLGFMPIIVSWLVVLGAMVIFNVKFNLINIIISTFIFGIGVDYSIFVMNGLLGSEKDVLLLSYHKTAILFSAVALIVSVGSMIFAKHPAINSVGFATLVGMVSAVVIAYVIQPFLYRHFFKAKKKKRA